jgi:hypothetical protein
VVDPATVQVTAQHAVQLQILYVDHPACGTRIHLDELGLQAAVDASGVANLAFVPPRGGTLRLTCAADGLRLQLGS